MGAQKGLFETWMHAWNEFYGKDRVKYEEYENDEDRLVAEACTKCKNCIHFFTIDNDYRTNCWGDYTACSAWEAYEE